MAAAGAIPLLQCSRGMAQLKVQEKAAVALENLAHNADNKVTSIKAPPALSPVNGAAAGA
jgi:hypothetical protein